MKIKLQSIYLEPGESISIYPPAKKISTPGIQVKSAPKCGCPSIIAWRSEQDPEILFMDTCGKCKKDA